LERARREEADLFILGAHKPEGVGTGYPPSNYHDSSGRCARELSGVDDSRLASV
jgi:hypothetical protein